ncbi:MAG: hypothetical protein K0S80_1691 [Neobacillus sp.]|nr:hypothetical protein [Neobacillus sp.]
MGNMSDKTFGVKVSEEVYDKVKNIIDASGVSAKEWFEKAVALTTVQDLKEGSGDYKQDLSELDMHTTRIYELVANMIQRANYLKDDAVKAIESKLESKDLTIAELQSKGNALSDALKQLEEVAKQGQEEKQVLSEQVEGLRAAGETNQALILEYKEKIDTLSSLVNEYKGFSTENAKLKTEMEKMKVEFEQREGLMATGIAELNATVKDKDLQIEQLQGKLNTAVEDHQKEVENVKANHVNELTQLTDRKELEKERAVLEIERKYQAKLEESHEQYNNKLAQLYEKLDRKETDKKKPGEKK